MIRKTQVGRCLKCGFGRDVPTALKTRVFVCPKCGHQGPVSYNNILVVWLKTFLVNGFWGVVFIGLAVAAVVYYPRVIGHYNSEEPDRMGVEAETPSTGSQP